MDKKTALAVAKAFASAQRAKTVWIYLETSKQVGDADHLRVFRTAEAAECWCAENDPEGVAFEYPITALRES
jgi:hypothetical protein